MIRYGFFDSEITGYDEEGMPIFDRAESSEFLAMFISKLISDGVLALPGDCFQVIAYDGMKVKVRPGFGIIRGRFAYDDKECEITLQNAPANYKRIDRIVLRVNYLQRLCEIVVKTGIPDTTPQPPELVRPSYGDYYELCLATISINSNQTLISQANITDTRYDSSVCGVVTQVIDHLDTAVFFAQLNAWYKDFINQADKDYSENMQHYLSLCQEIVNYLSDFKSLTESDILSWFEKMRGQLSEDAAVNLQNQLNDLKEWRFIDGYLRAPYGGVGIDDGYLIINDFDKEET